LGSLFLGSESSSFDSPTGLTLAAQPQVLERLKSVFFLNGFNLTILSIRLFIAVNSLLVLINPVTESESNKRIPVNC
jgi:hypothetical protein